MTPNGWYWPLKTFVKKLHFYREGRWLCGNQDGMPMDRTRMKEMDLSGAPKCDLCTERLEDWMLPPPLVEKLDRRQLMKARENLERIRGIQ